MPKGKSKPKRPPRRRAVGWCSTVLLLWALLPLVNVVFGVGVAIPALLGLIGLWWGFFAPLKLSLKGWKKAMVTVFIVILCLFIALGAVLSALMVVAAAKKPAEKATLVVLGALVIDDRPSVMLRGRLDAAAKYLEANPETTCIVSGGQGPNEAYTEAYVMKKYLVEQKGINSARILQEDQSTNTFENIKFSLKIIEEQGLEPTVAVATQEFHQYRAAQLLKKAGATAGGAVTCMSPLHLLLCYWVRECAAICRLWMLGY